MKYEGKEEKMRCPRCGEVFEPLEAMAEEDWREIFLLLPVFGNNGRVVFEYVEKFGVLPLRMKGKKVLRLLRDIARLLENGEFLFSQTRHKVSRHGVFEALTAVNNRHFERPLVNHNYLKTVMITIAGHEEKAASIAGEKELRKKEKGIMSSDEGGKEKEGFVSGAAYREKMGVDSLVDLIGRKL